MNVCIFDHNKIKKWKEFVENNEITLEESLEILYKKKPLVGNREGFSISLDFGYKFVYSIENAPSKDFTEVHRIKRLSGSSSRKGMYPNIFVFKELCELLDFKSFKNCVLKMNDKDPIPNIEIMEFIETRLNKK